MFDTMEAAARAAIFKYRRIFLGTGVKDIPLFLKADPAENCDWFARVTPNPDSIASAVEAGIPAAHLCAMEGPFSQRANETLWSDWNIECVVTKDSGEAGGLPAKIAAARALKISLIVVSRPVMQYPECTNEPTKVSQWLANLPFFKNAP